jgi:hypothetical protein
VHGRAAAAGMAIGTSLQPADKVPCRRETGIASNYVSRQVRIHEYVNPLKHFGIKTAPPDLEVTVKSVERLSQDVFREAFPGQNPGLPGHLDSGRDRRKQRIEERPSNQRNSC